MGQPTAAMSRLKDMEAADRPDVAAALIAGNVRDGARRPPDADGPAGGGTPIPTLSTPGEADAFVAARVAEGSDFIKIIYDDIDDAYGKLPTLDEETVAALATAAHARGRLAVAHIGNERYARGAIAAGVDGLAHLFVGTDRVAGLRTVCRQHAASSSSRRCRSSIRAAGNRTARVFLKEADTMKHVKPQFRGSPGDATGGVEVVLRRGATGDPAIGRG